MALTVCPLCEAFLSLSNKTKEHIIPNAIGGLKTVSGFICIDCNSKTGNTWDAALAKQLAPLCLLLQIKRDRGDVQSQHVQTTGGEKYVLRADGQLTPAIPIIQKHDDGAKLELNLRARSISHMREILIGLRRKLPELDVESLLAAAQPTNTYLSDPVHFSLSYGGEQECRSLVKSALALAYEAGIDPKQCELALKYLKEPGAEACLGFYYEKDLIRNRPQNCPIHVVVVDANPVTGLILGYVEYFGVMRYVMCLSDRYQGEQRSHQYAIDPISGAALAIDFEFNLSLEDIRAAYDYEKIPDGAMAAALENIMPAVINQSTSSEVERLIKAALRDVEINLDISPGEHFSPEQARRVAALIANKFMPLLAHVARNNRNAETLSTTSTPNAAEANRGQGEQD